MEDILFGAMKYKISQSIFIYPEKALSFDPYGYYSKKRLTAEKYPEENMPYYEEYPQVDSHWTIPEIFNKGEEQGFLKKKLMFRLDFDDTNYEKLDAEKRMENAAHRRKH